MLQKLFLGSPESQGGLTNEEVLVKACPEDFQRENPWSEYAIKFFYFGGGSIKNWKWRTKNKQEIQKQLSCFCGLLTTLRLFREDRKAVAGWMLSEMLMEVPD